MPKTVLKSKTPEYRKQLRLNRTPEQREHYRKYTNRWHAKNATRLCQKRLRLREHFNDLQRINYHKSRASRLLTRRAYEDQRREKINSQRRIHYAKNKHKNRAQIAAASARRRALKKGCKLDLRCIKKWMVDIKSRVAFRCYYCQRMFSTMDVCFDHVFPLSKGYPHRIENLCASCEPCNSRKHDKLISEWRTQGQLLFEL
jgi:5-methylcytosine-specific restriction endonuclease McrA